MCHVFKKDYENQPYCTSNVLHFYEEHGLLPMLFEFVKDICTFFLFLFYSMTCSLHDFVFVCY